MIIQIWIECPFGEGTGKDIEKVFVGEASNGEKREIDIISFYELVAETVQGWAWERRKGEGKEEVDLLIILKLLFLILFISLELLL